MKNIEKYKDIILDNTDVCSINRLLVKNNIKGFCSGFACVGCGARAIKWLLEEAKEPVLDDVERKYLAEVIKPFRKHVTGIMLTEDGLKFKDKSSDAWLGYSSPILSKLLRGDYSIVKIPWKPNVDEFYYYYSPYAGITCQQRWINTSSDYCMWKLGNCFGTKAEAETKGKEIMEKIEKEYRES